MDRNCLAESEGQGADLHDQGSYYRCQSFNDLGEVGESRFFRSDVDHLRKATAGQAALQHHPCTA